MIDLTKPIRVLNDRFYYGIDGKPSNPTEFAKRDPSQMREAEEYRQLFEEAPRTKLEHGKMLAMLKEIDKEGHCDIFDCDHASHKIPGLIAEIEGAAR